MSSFFFFQAGKALPQWHPLHISLHPKPKTLIASHAGNLSQFPSSSAESGKSSACTKLLVQNYEAENVFFFFPKATKLLWLDSLIWQSSLLKILASDHSQMDFQ